MSGSRMTYGHRSLQRNSLIQVSPNTPFNRIRGYELSIWRASVAAEPVNLVLLGGINRSNRSVSVCRLGAPGRFSFGENWRHECARMATAAPSGGTYGKANLPKVWNPISN